MTTTSERYDATLAEVRGPKVLDVGVAGQADFMGDATVRDGLADDPGWMHGVLRKAGFDTYGVDIDGQTIKRLRALGIDNVFEQSAEELERPEGPFDTIVAGEIIEHLANPGMFLVRARQHLAPGGRIVVTTPNPFSLLYMLRSMMKWPKTSPNPEHVAWFCPGTMALLAERCGLVVVKMRPIDDHEQEFGTRLYRTFVRILRTLGRVLPDRLRGNSILYVLVPE